MHQFWMMCFHLLQELHSLQCMPYIWWPCLDQVLATRTRPMLVWLVCRCLYEALLFILTVDYELSVMNGCFHVLGVSLVSTTCWIKKPGYFYRPCRGIVSQNIPGHHCHMEIARLLQQIINTFQLCWQYWKLTIYWAGLWSLFSMTFKLV